MMQKNQKIALGTVQFGMPYGIANNKGQTSPEDAKKIIDIARSRGLDTLDTAVNYGTSEIILGKIGVSDFRTITKLPVIPLSTSNIDDWINQQIQESKRRLNVSTIEGLLLHRPEQLLEKNGDAIKHALESVRSKGIVNKIGFSIYSPENLDKLCNKIHPDIVQTPYSLVDRSIVTSGWLHRMKDFGVEVHARSIFLQGLLLMPRNSIPPQFSRWGYLWERWHSWLVQTKTSSIAACVSYVLDNNAIDRIVLGVDTPNQLTEILDSLINPVTSFPDLSCKEDTLINPALWTTL